MKKTLLIAHRGLNREAPENTLVAFAKAKELGVDGVELDVLLSKDEHLVVTHNEDLSLFTGIRSCVHDLTLSELRKLDFGSHFSSQYKGEKIPTLREVFELLQGKMWINVEIKGRNIWNDGRELEIARLIQEMKMEDQIWISSFNIFALRRMMKIAPHLKRGYLFYEGQDPFSRRGIWNFYVSPQSWNLSRLLATPSKIRQAQQKKRQCWVWTVNDEQEVKQLISQGVDAIITDEARKFVSRSL